MEGMPTGRLGTSGSQQTMDFVDEDEPVTEEKAYRPRTHNYQRVRALTTADN
jgi:hypothetical protein